MYQYITKKCFEQRDDAHVALAEKVITMQSHYQGRRCKKTSNQPDLDQHDGTLHSHFVQVPSEAITAIK